MADESVYYRNGEVSVTSARFIVGSQTYAMRNVTSVKGITIWPGRLVPIAIIILGLVCIATISAVGISIGTILVASGVWLLKTRKPTHAILLTTAGGEIRAYESEASKEIGDVLDALNEAIVERA